MFRRIFLLWITCAIGVAASVFSEEEKQEESTPPLKYHLSVCSLFKNEARYLKEWIEFHRLVGVDHFYLYNNGSQDNCAEVLNPYLREGIITLVQWPDFISEQSDETTYKWSLSTQVTAFENAKIWASRETKWLTFLDVGEFIVPTQDFNVANMLQHYDDYPAVSLSSDFYDASPVNVVVPRRLMIETFELTSAPVQNIQKAVTKMIFKPTECTSFLWPPFRYNFKDGREPIVVSKKTMRINHYTNRKKIPWRFTKPKEKMPIDNRIASEEETQYWLDVGYEIEDQERAIQRFLPALLKKIGYEPIKSW